MTRAFMVYDRIWISVGDCAVFPRGMDGFVRHVAQLGNPCTHIRAFRVELAALKYGIENAKVGRGIRAAAGDPLPTCRIIGEVRVHQRVPEPGGAFAPMNKKMLC